MTEASDAFDTWVETLEATPELAAKMVTTLCDLTAQIRDDPERFSFMNAATGERPLAAILKRGAAAYERQAAAMNELRRAVIAASQS